MHIYSNLADRHSQISYSSRMNQPISSLADLDELVLACRDQRARQYIFEAIANYKAMAYRSAIVSAWVAICFDFIDKVHELALSGDKEAEQLSKEINEARMRGDLSWALKFEKMILQSARDKFELISPLEFVDLERLQEDRNRCAHPSLASDGEPFQPSPELARLHIRSAVVHFLQHPPLQGKGALDRLLAEVESNYFPVDSKKAKIAFAMGPLKKPRRSLIANFVVVLVKRAIDVNCEWRLRMRIVSALIAVRALHTVSVNEVMQEKLSALIHGGKDETIQFSLRLIASIPDLWVFLKPDAQLRLQLYTEDVPDDEMDILEWLLEFPPLTASAERRISRASIESLMNATWFFPPKQAIHRFIDAYINSKNFEVANSLAKELRGNAPVLELDQIEKIITGAGNNHEISNSFGFTSLLTGIVKAGKISKQDLEELLARNLLIDHIPIEDKF